MFIYSIVQLNATTPKNETQSKININCVYIGINILKDKNVRLRDAMAYFTWACYIIVPYLVQKNNCVRKKSESNNSYIMN